MMESEVTGNCHASFGKRDGETRMVRAMKVRAVPTSPSPLLANIALDAMERLFGCEDTNGNPLSPSWRKGRNRGISLIRYADDLVVTAPSREVLEQYVIPKLKAFLLDRGLQLSEAKTRIVPIDEGFHFLGFEIRRFRGTLLTRPEKAKMIAHLRDIKAYLNAHQQTPAIAVIKALNPKLRGWANYYRHSSASQRFAYADHRVWQMLWRWAKRRHPNKPSKWIKALMALT
jgi:RNA-directed DNA polymerase